MRFDRLILSLLAGFLLVDLASRLVPPSSYLFRTREAAVVWRTGLGGFQQSLRISKPDSSGDLASLGNYPRIRQFRNENFTSDACGNRNRPEALERGGTRILLWGDSFFAGDSNSDENLMSTLLEQKLETPVYSAASMDVEYVRAVARRLRMKEGWLVVDLLERIYYAEGAVSAGLDQSDVCAEVPAKVRFRRVKESIRNLFQVSAFKAWGQGGIRFLQDGRILPNPLQSAALPRKLRNGEDFLFFPEEMPRRDSPDSALRFAQWIAGEARKEGLQTLFVLIPNKYTVYSPLLRDAPSPEDRGGIYLGALERALGQAGLPTINLTVLLREEAEKAYSHGHFIYWPDDTHWNGDGLRLAADAVADRLRQAH